MQPKISDIVKMWTAQPDEPPRQVHGIVENRGRQQRRRTRDRPAEEIDALIHAVTQLLTEIQYPMEKKRVVWVVDDRVYRSGTEHRLLEKRPWETAPYANVHEYSHDVFPAKAALGAGGCADCHSPGSEFFYAPALVRLFDETGQPGRRAAVPAVGPPPRHGGAHYVVPVLRQTGALQPVAVSPFRLIAFVGGSATQWVFGKRRVPGAVRLIPLVVACAAVLGAVFLMLQPDLMAYMLPTPMWLDANHFLVAVVVMVIGLVALLWELRQRLADHGQPRGGFGVLMIVIDVLCLLVAVVAGVLVFLKLPGLDTATRVSYTLFDTAITVLLIAAMVTVLRGVSQQFRSGGGDVLSASHVNQ